MFFLNKYRTQHCVFSWQIQLCKHKYEIFFLSAILPAIRIFFASSRHLLDLRQLLASVLEGAVSCVAQRAKFAKKVHKPPLRVNAINLELNGFNASIWVPWIASDPQKLWCTDRSIQIHKICVKISCIFAPILPYGLLWGLWTFSLKLAAVAAAAIPASDLLMLHEVKTWYSPISSGWQAKCRPCYAHTTKGQ